MASPNGYVVMPGGLTRVASDVGRAHAVHAARRLEQGHLGACPMGR
ncbi:MAG: circularly permuted type 2 ATP-grasp protein [Comamonadaceae bacterium]|nr:circularly permuted type 2 ATP-grasp protein [Comamonadaceae bacterium]